MGDAELPPTAVVVVVVVERRDEPKIRWMHGHRFVC